MAYDAGEFKGPNGVNVGECLRVADLVERSGSFVMWTEWRHDCGTPGCIIGHVLAPDYVSISTTTDLFTWSVAGERLGVNEPAYRELFAPKHDAFAHWQMNAGEPGFITNAHAAACLRKLAATGEVDWLGTKPTAD